MCDVPALRFPEFTEEWQYAKFKDVVTLQRGSSPRPIINYLTTSDDGVNWVKIGDMPTSGRIVTSTEEKITKEGAKKSRHVSAGDLILSNSMSYGLPYIMGIDGYIHDGWFVLKNYEQTFDRDYLCNLLISDAIQKQYKKLAAGGVVQNISSDLVNSVNVFIPCLDEQKKIAKLLNLIDDRISTQNKIIEKYESLIKGLVVTHYSTIPHTIKVKIQDLGEAYSTMVMSKEQLTNDGNPCIFYGELFTLYGCVIGEIKSRTSLEKVSSTLSHGRDLLFPASTTVDALSLIAPSALMQKGIILGGDMFGIKVAETYNPIYLSYYFNYIANKRLSKYAKGTTIIHLHYNEIANVAIELPDIEEQDKIVSTILGYSTKLSVEEAILEKLSDLKQYLLKQMFI